MKILIFGPSGSGKTYVSQKLRDLGVNAVDADQEFLDNHEFLWDKEFLKNYLDKNLDIYLFGLSGNIFQMLDLFDKVYFLKIDNELLKARLIHESRENPMGKTEYQRQAVVNFAKMLEEKSKELGIEFIDATNTPEQIFQQIKSD
ncbi:MAG: hypothetical protein Q7S03_00865 [bacterium]|nr:hypothetical protein [bacterium]